MAARAQTARTDRVARPAPAPGTAAPDVRPAAERRRRARHFALRRRDLTIDAVAGFLAAILLITVTAGLGVLALLLIPLVASLLVSGWLERRHRRVDRSSGPGSGRG